MVVGQFTQEAECVVIGAGPAGCAAASRAAELGLQTVLVDGAPPCARAALAAGVEILTGCARFEDARQVSIDGGAHGRLHFKRAIVATGLEPEPPRPEWADLPGITTWRSGDPPGPGRVLVVGSGGPALEAASRCAAAGCSVTVASDGERLLPDGDEALLEALPRGLRDLEIIPAGSADPGRYDHVLLTARRPATGSLGLDKARVGCNERGAIPIDGRCATSNPRVLAAGAVTGADPEPGLARYQGRIAAEVAAGRDSALDARVWPRVVMTDPPIAWCGLTEPQARATGVAHRVLEARRGDPPAMLARLVVDGESAVVLGVGLAGAGAPDAIAQGVLAVEMGAVAEDLAALVHAAGSLGELIAEAARAGASS